MRLPRQCFYAYMIFILNIRLYVNGLLFYSHGRTRLIALGRVPVSAGDIKVYSASFMLLTYDPIYSGESLPYCSSSLIMADPTMAPSAMAAMSWA